MINEAGQQHEVSRRLEEKQSFDERGEVKILELGWGTAVRKKKHRDPHAWREEITEGGGKRGRYQEMGEMEVKMVPKINALVIFSRAQNIGMARNAGGE